ncbi:hypothetical protein [Micromonospora sp. RL09-050-HVF-A]|uniref:hypothetical protein n=1 Tax=Micromonospora sp. RL09-050-HVF-A TaxID=1703433 RepID=UPI001C5F5C99|nr:hypothetical protein [Micromonospora sp. RL09-050-HVF-A]MBW4705828.1 hypothetical protein [Micromonospora sp. RL09-050-HVF-A]
MTGHRLDQETAERLLSGPGDGPVPGPAPLVALLIAIRAAANPAELRGEPAAMSAYRAGMSRSAPPGGPTSADPSDQQSG